MTKEITIKMFCDALLVCVRKIKVSPLLCRVEEAIMVATIIVIPSPPRMVYYHYHFDMPSDDVIFAARILKAIMQTRTTSTLQKPMTGCLWPPPCNTAVAMTKTNRYRTSRCGRCNDCMKPPCGSCKHCMDLPRFGGPGVKKQTCLRRKCLDQTRVVIKENRTK